MLGPIFMGVSYTWRLPFMYWNQQMADYYAGHCIFHKTEIQTVILRGVTVLNLNWFKRYDTNEKHATQSTYFWDTLYLQNFEGIAPPPPVATPIYIDTTIDTYMYRYRLQSQKKHPKWQELLKQLNSLQDLQQSSFLVLKLLKQKFLTTDQP